MPLAKIPDKFRFWLPLFDTWHKWLNKKKLTAAEACISFVQAHPEVNRIVVGVESKHQLEQLIEAEKKSLNTSWPNINCSDNNLINPSNWNIL